MQTSNNIDFLAFRAKASGAAYEKRNAPDLADTLDQIAGSVESFKSEHASRLDAIETKLSRPGAFHSASAGGNGPIRMLRSVDGKEFPLLFKGDRLASKATAADLDFSLGEFVRDSVCGSRKAMGRGPALVPSSLSNTFIDDVRPLVAFAEAGAPTVVIDGPRAFARIEGDPTVYQHTENADDIEESTVDLEPVVVDPKMLAVIVPVSEEVVTDSPNLDGILRAALAGAFAQKLEALAFAKLIADADILESAAGQDPAQWQKVLEAVGAAMAAGQHLPTAMISSAADFVARASQLASTAGTWLGKPPALQQMQEYPTSNLAAGTGFFGDFGRAMIIAARAELRVEVIRWAKATRAQHALVAHARLDAYVMQPKALYRQLKTVV